MGFSRQRESLLSVLRSTKSHPTANEIYEMMRKENPKISLGTVYRNLALLSEQGVILRIDTEHDSVHQHYHFVCNKCGKVEDLLIEPLNITGEVEKETGCTVSGHMLVFYGECRKCKNL